MTTSQERFFRKITEDWLKKKIKFKQDSFANKSTDKFYIDLDVHCIFCTKQKMVWNVFVKIYKKQSWYVMIQALFFPSK